MQPQQPNPHAQYDFIFNPAQPTKKSLFSFSGGPLLPKILVIVGGFFVLAIILAMVANLGGNKDFDKAAMLGIAQDQAEISRLLKLGEASAKSQAIMNFNATATLATSSDETTFTTYISSNGLKPSQTDLVLKLDGDATTQLNSALSSGNFDTTYKGVIDKKLETYQTDLTAAYKTAGSNGKKILAAQYKNAALLRAQLAASH